MAEEKVIIVFGADIKQLEKGINNASSKIKNFGNKLSGYGKKMSTRFTAPLTLAGGVALRSAAKFEKLKTTLNVLTGSAEKGGKAFERLVKFSAKTPFQLDDLVKANNTMMGFGLSADQAYGSLQKLGDIAAVSGGDLQRIAIAFGQSAAEGRVMTRDILQFINNGVPMYELLADVTGKTASEVRALASEGKITFDVLNAAFDKATSKGGKFHGGMETLSGTLSGLFSTLKDNLNIAFAELGKEIANAFELQKNIPKFIEFIQSLVDKFKALAPETKRLVVLVGALGAALGPIVVVLGTLTTSVGSIVGGFGSLVGFTGKMIPKLKDARKAMLGLSVSMNAVPIIAAAVAIGLVAKKIYEFIRAKKQARLDEYAKQWGDLNLKEAQKELDGVNKKIEDNQKLLDSGNLLFDIDGVKVARKELLSQNNTLLEQQGVLQGIVDKRTEEKKQLDEIHQLTQQINETAGGTTTVDVDSDPEAEAQRLIELKQRTAEALATTDQKRFELEKANTKAHYDELIKMHEGNATMIAQLEQAKTDKLNQIESDYHTQGLENFMSFLNERKEMQTAVDDANAVTEEQKRDLEIKRTQEFYTNLIEQAKKFGIDFSMLSDSMKAKVQEIKDNYEETTKETSAVTENINNVLKGSFSSLGQSIANSFGDSKSVFGAFLSTFLSTATTIIAGNLATSTSHSIEGVTKDASKIPFASFALPALIAGAVATVNKAFSGIKKFEKGGIVSTPTLGLFGEYAGARNNPEVVAPLDKLQGMIANSGGSQVQVGGEFRLRGQDLIVALQRAEKNRDRIR
jgi:tape measure domain-containing protein